MTDSIKTEYEIFEEQRKIDRAESGKKAPQKSYDEAIRSIPIRYRDIDVKVIPSEVFEAIKTKGSLYLWGNCGVGKTHIGYAILKKRLDKLLEVANHEVASGGNGFYAFNRDVNLYNFPTILQKIRDSMDDKTSRLSITDYNDKILILDDVGAEKFSEWSIEQLYELINSRYESMSHTILISNLSLKELAEKVGDRIPSRIAEMCEVIKLEGEDRRIKTSEASSEVSK